MSLTLVIDKQNEVGKEESMSSAGSSIGGTSIRIGGGKKRPSPESNSGGESNSVKKTRAKRHVFTGLEKQILVNLYETNKLMDTEGIQGNLSLGETLRFRPWWKHKHHGSEMGGTSGDHERELLFYHCWCPKGGGVFLFSHNKIHDTQMWFTFFPKMTTNCQKLK